MYNEKTVIIKIDLTG